MHGWLLVLAAFPLAQGDRVEIPPIPERAILVRVRDPQGRPLAGAQVVVRSMRTEYKQPEVLGVRPPTGGSWGWPVLTDDRGTVLFEDLEEGSWRVAAGKPPEFGYSHTSPVALEVERPGLEIDLRLEPLPQDRLIGGTLCGPDGEPVSSGGVRFFWDDQGSLEQAFSRVDREGRFLLLTDDPTRIGALLASSGDHRPATVELVRAGARNVQVQLGLKRTLELEVRDAQQNLIPNGTPAVLLRMVGHDVLGTALGRGRPQVRWKLPDVPFDVSASAFGYEQERFGPFDPETLGPKLVLNLKSLPRLQGCVTHEGRPVAARLTYQRPDPRLLEDPLNVEGAVRSPHPSYRRPTAEDGTFDVPIHDASGSFELLAWSPEHGRGSLGPLEFPDGSDMQGLVVPLTEPPGEVTGHVLLPPGRQPEEVWLVVSTAEGYMPLREDGSYRLPQLPPGPCWIRIVAAFGTTDWRPVSTTISRASEEGYVRMSHGPTEPPEWLEPIRTFSVTVEAGKSIERDLDLASPMPCRLRGRVCLDGEAVAPRSASLDRGVLGMPVAQRACDEQAGFLLQAMEPGEYRLRVCLVLKDGSTWIVFDRVRIDEGESSWSFDVPTGALRVLPQEIDGRREPFEGRVRWQGPRDLRVFVSGGPRDWQDKTFFPQVPVGEVQLQEHPWRGSTVLGEATVESDTTAIAHQQEH